MSRRSFLTKGAAATIGFSVVPSMVLGKSHGYTAPSDKLNIAGIGVGGRGAGVLDGMKQENIVALVDCNDKYAAHQFDKYPKAKRYRDYREMYDEMGKEIDAVMVATADHTHAIIAADAMAMGKHVYCEKPLTHSVYESRLLTALADKYGVATQMGNQGSSDEGVALACEWIWNGEIGEVTKVETFTDRPIWPQGLNVPEKVDRIPRYLDWDLFTGPAEMRPFSNIYPTWNWRGWWAYGTGALGDMACHILHPVFMGLNLKYPSKVSASSTLLLSECAPQAQIVKYTFPARDNMPKVAMPEVEVLWYDGGLKPELPKGVKPGTDLNNAGGGVIFHGTKDTLICGCYGKDPWLVSGRVPNAPKVVRRVNNTMKAGHQIDWIRACKENPANRIETRSPFSQAGPFNEMVVMGVLAVRLQSLNKELEWDGANMRFTNIGANEEIRTVIKDGFTIKDGHPTFAKTWTDPVNAQAFAQELIKHNYREGWKLQEMPR